MAERRPTTFFVGMDPMNEGMLAVIPEVVARKDAALIRTLQESRNIGEVRRGDPDALRLVEDDYSGEDEHGEKTPFKELPDSHPYDFEGWFGHGEWWTMFPEAKVRTTEHAPAEIFEEFGREDHGYGFIDYNAVDYLDTEDVDAIINRLIELGHTVIDDDFIAMDYEWG